MEKGGWRREDGEGRMEKGGWRREDGEGKVDYISISRFSFALLSSDSA